MVKIRQATPADLKTIIDIYNQARDFMSANGNPNQWIDGYPSASLMTEEIAAGHCYVVEDERTGRCEGVFCLIEGNDPTYAIVTDGKWLNDSPYATIHRLASAGTAKGIATACIDWCRKKCANLRADTHHDNLVMQHLLEKTGFVRCGTIYTHNGTPRIAYQLPPEH